MTYICFVDSVFSVHPLVGERGGGGVGLSADVVIPYQEPEEDADKPVQIHCYSTLREIRATN